MKNFKKNVVFLRSNPIFPDPRVEKEVVMLLNADYEVLILGWDRSASLPLEDRIIVNNFECTILRYGKKSEFGSGIKNIFKLISFQFFLLINLIKLRKKLDVIHAADFDTVLPSLFMKFVFKKKVIYDIYDFYTDSFPVPGFLKGIIKKIDLWAIKNADGTIITNESRLHQIKGSAPKNLTIIHNTPYEVSIEKNLVSKNDSVCLRLVYVGVLQPHRFLLEMIDIFKKHSDWELVIAGFGQLEDEILKRTMNFKNIIFRGRVDYSEGLYLSSSADALFAIYDPIIKNHKYSSPNKLYEAMMLSLPIIVCEDTGIDQVVEKNNIGVVVSYNSDHVEKELMCLSRQKELSKERGRNARNLYDEKYSIRIMENRLLNLYRKVLGL